MAGNILKKIKSLFYRSKNIPATKTYTKSYSQYGEDQIILALIYIFNLKDVNYMDIGANDPFTFNNTALLYESGINGINIEPDPKNFEKIKLTRTKDVNLNIGIGPKNEVLLYYRFSDSVYNTFSLIEYNKLKIRKELINLPELHIEVFTYNHIVTKYLMGNAPKILFIDTEGLDDQIIKSIDFNSFAPQIICIETFSYGEFRKDNELIANIIKNGYHLHADTFINSIFIHKTLLPYPSSR